jgi:release factor glutamine methyltransferase
MSAAEQDTPWTVGRLLGWTQQYLQRGGIESPRLCAEILLAHAMQCERLRLYTRFEEVPGAEVRERFRTLVQKAAGGQPIAYLTGTKEFFSLAFEVTPEVLIPRPETEILVERAIGLLRKTAEPPAVLDLGTGSGCIAVSLAKHLPQARIAASDISEAALAVARRNAERHGVAERIEVRDGDLFTPWDDGTQFDVILCNPPYVATEGAPVEASVRDFEPHGALFAGADGLDVIRRVVREGPRRVRAGGHLLVEMAYDQAAAVRKLMEGASWQEVVAYRDAAGHERVLHARRRAAEQVQVA